MIINNLYYCLLGIFPTVWRVSEQNSRYGELPFPKGGEREENVRDALWHGREKEASDESYN